MRAGPSSLALGALLGLCAAPAAARAQTADATVATSATRARDGVWLSAGLRARFGGGPGGPPRGDATLYLASFGWLGQRAALLEARLLPPDGGGWGVAGGYAAALVERPGRGDELAHLFRLGPTFAGRVGPVELDGRALGELLAPEGAAASPRLRVRARATFPAPVGRWPRPFVAEEVFWEESRGFGSRHRFSAGLRAVGALGGALDLDVFYQREDRRGAGGFDALVVQAVWTVGR